MINGKFIINWMIKTKIAMGNNLNNQTSVPLSIDRVRLTQLLDLRNSELELASAIYQTYSILPYTLGDNEPACILGLSDIARLYNLPYQTMYAASRALLLKGVVRQEDQKFVLLPRFMEAMSTY